MELLINKTVNIPIERYKEITKCDDTFKNSTEWDDANGLEITYNSNPNYDFCFKIIDTKKFLLAQIKYGF